MTSARPQIPFVWPSPQSVQGASEYEFHPPYGHLIEPAKWLFGVVPALDSTGLQTLRVWFEQNIDLKASLVIIVYPSCHTRQADLQELRSVADLYSDRLYVRINALDGVRSPSMNALCISADDPSSAFLLVGPTENLGLCQWEECDINLAFRSGAALLEAFRKRFDSLWERSCDIHEPFATEIPELVLPKGSAEAASAWQEYQRYLRCPQSESHSKGASPATSVDATSSGTEAIVVEILDSPTARIGVEPHDELAEFMSGLYSKGSLVTINKLSKIPPLDAPLEPGLFGERSEIRSGTVTRKVSMRISVIDEQTLKEIDARKKAVSYFLTKYSFSLADGTRWMPIAAHKLFEAELKRVNESGKKLISDLMRGDVNAFLAGKRPKLIEDLNRLHAELGLPGDVPPEVVEDVFENLKKRFTKAQSANFVPEISYSEIAFRATSNEFSSPWGQAFSVLSDLAAFQRSALMDDTYFYRGLTSPKQEIQVAMNVADDVIYRFRGSSGLSERCEEELDLIMDIQKASIDSKQRCLLIWKLVRGSSSNAIREEMAEFEKGSDARGADRPSVVA